MLVTQHKCCYVCDKRPLSVFDPSLGCRWRCAAGAVQRHRGVFAAGLTPEVAATSRGTGSSDVVDVVCRVPARCGRRSSPVDVVSSPAPGRARSSSWWRHFRSTWQPPAVSRTALWRHCDLLGSRDLRERCLATIVDQILIPCYL